MLVNLLRYIKRRMLLFKENGTLSYQNITYVNWWGDDSRTYWFAQLIHACKDYSKVNYSLYSVFGPREKVREYYDGLKIFYSGENLETFHQSKGSNRYFIKLMTKRRMQYGDYCCGDVNLSLGYGYRCDKDYFRLPLWVIDRFSPCSSEMEIKYELERIERNQFTSDRTNEAVLMCSHDDGGIRKQIVDEVSKVVDVKLPGKFMHNTGDLWVDNKMDYISHFRFNICPENVDAPGYVSEKLFDCLVAGCIPIYVGSSGNAEPRVLNQNRIIYWNVDGNNTKQIELIRELSTNQACYDKYVAQTIFNTGAETEIFNMINDVKIYLERQIANTIDARLDKY